MREIKRKIRRTECPHTHLTLGTDVPELHFKRNKCAERKNNKRNRLIEGSTDTVDRTERTLYQISVKLKRIIAKQSNNYRRGNKRCNNGKKLCRDCAAGAELRFFYYSKHQRASFSGR